VFYCFKKKNGPFSMITLEDQNQFFFTWLSFCVESSSAFAPVILNYATVDEDARQSIGFVASGGAFAGTEAELFALLRLGVELGCEYVDMETTWSDAARSKVYTIHTRIDLDSRGCWFWIGCAWGNANS
jgi:hypothetical protein